MHISMMQSFDFWFLRFGIVWCWRSISCFRLLTSLPYMSISSGIVISIALHEVDNAPDTKTSSKSDNECLQNAYCRIKKCHKISPFLPLCGCPKKGQKKRRPVFITAAVISPPDMAGSPRRLNVGGVAVFSCKMQVIC